jgi:hypothetical protein
MALDLLQVWQEGLFLNPFMPGTKLDIVCPESLFLNPFMPGTKLDIVCPESLQLLVQCYNLQ